MVAAACVGALAVRLTIRHLAAAWVDSNNLRGMENLLGSGRKRVRTFPLLRRARLSQRRARGWHTNRRASKAGWLLKRAIGPAVEGKGRSEEHTSELQSQSNIVCR